MATDEFKIDLTVDTKQAEKSIDKVDKKLKDSTKNSPDYKPDIDTSKVETKLDKLKKSVGGFSLDSILGGLSAGGGFAIATKGFDLLSGAVTGAFNSYKEFDSAIQNIATLGVVDDLDGLKNVLNEVSKTTVDDASVLAAATYQALSAGVKGSNEELGKFAQTASKVATAGGSDAETAVDALTTVMNSFKISTDEADTVSDQFFGTIKAGKTTFPELAGSLSNVSSIAATAGIKFGEIGGSIAQLTSLGVPTSVATNQLKVSIEKLLNPTADGIKAFKAMGLSVADVAQKLKQPVAEGGGLVNTLNVLKDGTDKLNLTLFQTAGGSEAAAAALNLTGENAKSAFANIDAVLNKSAGSAEFAYKEASKSIENQLGLIKGSIQAFFNDIFTFIQPAVSALLTGVSTTFDFLVSVLGGAVGFVKEFGNTLFTILQNIASSPFGSLISSIFTTVKDAILSVIPTIDQIETGFASFKQTISDFSPIIAGVVTTLAAYGVYTNLALIKTTALNVITKSIAVAQGAYNTVLAFGSGVVTAITTAYSFLSSGQVIATAKTLLFSAAQAALNVVMNLNPVGLVVTAIGALVAGLIYAYKTSEDFRKILNNLYEKAIKPLIDALAEGATSVLKFFGLLSDEPDTKSIDKSTKKVEKAKKEVEGLNDELDKVKPPKGIVTPVQAKTLSEYIEQLAKLKVAGKESTKEYESLSEKASKLAKEEKALTTATDAVKNSLGLGKEEASKFVGALEKLVSESNNLKLSLSSISSGAVVGNLEGVVDALDNQLNNIKKREPLELATFFNFDNKEINKALENIGGVDLGVLGGDGEIATIKVNSNEILDILKEQFDKRNELIKLQTDNELKLNKEKYDLEKEQRQKAFESELIDKGYSKEQIAELTEQFNSNELAKDKIFSGNQNKLVSDSLAKLFGIETKFNEDKLALEEETADKEKEIRQKQLDALNQYADFVGETFAGLVTDFEGTSKNLLKLVAKTALDTLEALIPVLVAQITGISLAQPDSVTTFGATGLIRAAILTGLLKGAVAIARNSIGGLQEGGLVGTGNKPKGNRDTELRWLDPQEFVLNRDAVKSIGVDNLQRMNAGNYSPTITINNRELISELQKAKLVQTHIDLKIKDTTGGKFKIERSYR